ncbi:MAG: sigma-54 dependent transcriptional regulator [Myxococcota bacterium]|nr:sigma-54 dependent transcriptional regulator [Myxococcota bacterium]
MTPQNHILVVDDEHGILQSLKKIYERENFRVSITDSGEEALEIVRSERVDLVLSDIMMPKMSGIELLRAVKAISPSIEVVMMTAFGTVENAVDCMRKGAYDFISKPLKRAMVVRSAQRALEHRALIRENQVLRETIETVTQGDVIGQSTAMCETLNTVSQAAPSAATILLQGESGTGKELLARKVHSLSDCRAGPFVPVNCAALPDNLLESELFGHEKGAFTGAQSRREGRFERASGGTLFLDEIGETSPAVQVRLLRVLQEGEIERLGGSAPISVDVRVVAATNRRLEEAVKEGRFREDLYYRLNVIQIEVPPLRLRHGDIPLLAQYFLARFAEKNNKSMRGFSEAAIRVLETHSWPGNVRELENTIERSVVLCKGDVVSVEDLPRSVAGAEGEEVARTEEGVFVPFGVPLEEIEKKIIRETLDRTGGDKKTAAHLLGIATRTIYRKLDES